MSQLKRQNNILTIFLIAALAVVLIRTAWVCDDAYISMRTVDNFVHGHGLVYNLGERVQSFTHPLWLFLITLPYLFTQNAYFTLVVSSMILSLAVAVVLVARIAQSQPAAVLGITVILFSKAFIDFSSSGLENPLSHLLLVLFASVYFAMGNFPKKLFVLALIAALGAVNRLDTILITLPALLDTCVRIWFSAKGQRKRALRNLLLGFSPLMAWLIFSVLYYGFFFPNTAYAKLNTGIPRGFLLRQGLAYYLSSFDLDPLTLLVIIAGLGLAVFSRSRQKIALAFGIGLYLAYILSIGGDFMNGRFLTVPFLAAVVILTSYEGFSEWRSLLVPLGLVVLIGLGSPFPPPFSRADYGQADRHTIIDERGVSDERAYYYPTTGLLTYCLECRLPNHEWVTDGLAAKDEPGLVKIRRAIGFFGYYAGPAKYVVDRYALLDPLLARLPIPDVTHWRIGHFKRVPPRGYQETLVSGSNQIGNPALRAYNDQLMIITRGDIFDPERLRVIWMMNTGQFDDLLYQYISR